MMAVLDTIKGIFNYEDEPNQEPINTPEQQKLYDMVWQDYQYFKEQRQTQEEIWKKEQRFYKGDHWYGLRPDSVSRIRPNSVDNVAWSQIESVVSKLCGWMPYPDFEAQEPNDEQKAQDLNDFMPYELRCIKFKQKHIRAVRRFAIHGPLIYKTIYDPTVEGGKGNNRYLGNNDILPVDLGSFFPDPRIRDFIYLQKAEANIVHTVRSVSYFAERWPEQGKKVQPDNMSADVEIFDDSEYSLRNFNTDSSNTGTETQLMRSGLIEYWYKGTPKYMSDEDKTLFKELADQKLSEGTDPSECLAKAKGTMDGVHCVYISTSGVFLEHKAYVYDHGQYPFVARTLFPDEDNPWGKGYMRDMISPQIMLNKFSEIAVETSAKMGNAAIAYEEDAITKPDTWKERRSLPGAMLPTARLDGIKELQGVNVPQTVFNMLEYYKDMLQKIPGQFDSANGQANPNVTSGEQAKALIAASSNRLGLATEIIEDALEEVFMQYIELMAQFYTTERVARITGRNVSMSRDKLISYSQTTYDAPQEDGSTQPVPVQEEYVPKFDIRVNVGVEKPKDREYYIQTAFNLLKTTDPLTGMPMIDGEAVRYAVENGRLEPFSVIQARMQREQQIQHKMAQLQQENDILNEQVNQMAGHIDAANQNNMQATHDTLKLLQQQDQQDHQKQMDQQKMAIEAGKVAMMGQRSGGGQQ